MAYSDDELLVGELKSGDSACYVKPADQMQENGLVGPLPPHDDALETGFGNEIKVTTFSSNEEAITPFSLLAHLHSIKEFELYYYLFNQVSLVSIAGNKLEISREGAEKGLNNRLAEILFTWTGARWNVIITDTSDQQSLKEKMKARFMESEEWKMLQDYSGSVTLTDIILD